MKLENKRENYLIPEERITFWWDFSFEIIVVAFDYEIDLKWKIVFIKKLFLKLHLSMKWTLN